MSKQLVKTTAIVPTVQNLEDGDYVKIGVSPHYPSGRIAQFGALIFRVSVREGIPFRPHLTGEKDQKTVQWEHRKQVTLVACAAPGKPVWDHPGTRAQYNPTLAYWEPAACEPEFLITEVLPRDVVRAAEEAEFDRRRARTLRTGVA